MSRIVYKQESYAIIGACFEVYNELGSGFLEAVYHECLILEFLRRNIPTESKPQLQLQYKGQVLQQHYVPDFVCYGKIILELKSTKALSDQHRAQTINYLKVTGHRLGLLVNFGSHPKLQYERFAN